MYKKVRRIDMKKSNLIKLFSILLMSIMVIMFTTNVWAEDNDFTTLQLIPIQIILIVLIPIVIQQATIPM